MLEESVWSRVRELTHVFLVAMKRDKKPEVFYYDILLWVSVRKKDQQPHTSLQS